MLLFHDNAINRYWFDDEFIGSANTWNLSWVVYFTKILSVYTSIVTSLAYLKKKNSGSFNIT